MKKADLAIIVIVVVALGALAAVSIYGPPCPPRHVYIDYGETPQAGCWPEGVARQYGVWPPPEGQK